MRCELRLPPGLADDLPPVLVVDDAALAPFHHELAGSPEPPSARLAYAALHVVMTPAYRGSAHSLAAPGPPEEIAAAIDWPATMALRGHAAAHGLAVAEAMDTAQRFFLGWPTARRLIEACGRLHLSTGFVAGAGADQRPDAASWVDLVDAVVEQARVIQAAGGDVIILPLPWLPRHRAGEEDYVRTYAAIIGEIPGPIFVHWLGPMFLPELDGYFPGESLRRILALDPEKVRGIKLSVLDAGLEVRLRRELEPRGQIVLTGDDVHFAHLLRGGDPVAAGAAPAPSGTTRIGRREVAIGDFSHALLGVLDGLAAPAGLALRFLARGRTDRFLDLLLPGEALGRAVFEAPTQHYKAGLAFLSWLNGRQATFDLVNHEERARSLAHYLRVAARAAAARAIDNAPLAATRLDSLLRGV